MAKLIASDNLDVFKFSFPSENGNFPSRTGTLIRLWSRKGDAYEYTGKFRYDSKGSLLAKGSEITGIRSFRNNNFTSVLVDVTSLRISVLDYFKFAEQNDVSGFIRYIFKGSDTITGSQLVDNLFGGDGNDLLTGRGGGDSLTGGKGKDRFVYNTINDSRPGSRNRDTITDFNGREGDRIDLQKIDGNPKVRGNQKLRFIGSKAFGGKEGEVRFAGGVLQIDNNLDRKADIEIALTGVTSFSQNFLIL